MVDIQKIKEQRKQLMLDAAQNIQEENKVKAPKGFAEESLKKQETIIRKNNFAIRETKRALLGITVPTDFGFLEKQIGPTLDFHKVAPNAVAKKAGRPVARLHQFVEGRIPEGFGTGFMVSPNLLITNHHVFSVQNEADGCAANFFYEVDDKGLNPGITFLLRPDKFFTTFKDLDFSLVYVEPVATDKVNGLAEINFLPLIETVGKLIVGEPVNIIEYPLGGPKQYAYTENAVTSINDEKGLIRYTTDTLSASSGSPAFNKFYEVAALHHMGVPFISDGKILTIKGEVWDGEDENEVQWVANEGISISRIVAYLKTLTITDKDKAVLLNELLVATKDPLLESAGNNLLKPQMQLSKINNLNNPLNLNDAVNLNPDNLNNIKPDTMDQFVFNFYGNTTLNIGMPGQGITIKEALAVPIAPAAPAAFEEQSIRFDEDYDDRSDKGYAKEFIKGFTLETPSINKARADEMLKEDGSDLILKYYHYSLAMNKVRRMQMWSAVNVDYNRKGNKSRKQLGTDFWRSDPRIPAANQITRKEIYDPAKKIDLGHIVRREDSCWGDDDVETEFSNSDTFHYTNCTPQHEAFNRASPPEAGIHGVWGKLEDQIQKQLKLTENKANIFAGPVLNNQKDPSENFGLGLIQYPLKFWKVIVVSDEQEGLLSYGFLLDQTNVIRKFGIGVEKLDFNLFKRQQISIREITRLTGVKFDQQLYETDVLRNNFNEGAEPVISYEKEEDIQIKPLEI